MSGERDQELSTMLAGADLEWALAGDRGATARILARLDEASADYSKRFGTPADLLAACQAEPDKMRAFLQSLVTGVSADYLAMVARILLRSAEVVGLQVDFAARKTMSVRIEIADPDGKRHAFVSAELWDAQVLRHFGLMEASGAPIIDGYYALRS